METIMIIAGPLVGLVVLALWAIFRDHCESADPECPNCNNSYLRHHTGRSHDYWECKLCRTRWEDTTYA